MSTICSSIPYPSPIDRLGALLFGLLTDAASPALIAETEPALRERWLSDLGVEAAPYSIRIPTSPANTLCALCEKRLLAAGPTGFIGDRPICDLCLLDGSEPLGMLLALAAVVRAFGRVEPEAPLEASAEASRELATFARLYELVAAKSGPPRPFVFPEKYEF